MNPQSAFYCICACTSFALNSCAPQSPGATAAAANGHSDSQSVVQAPPALPNGLAGRIVLTGSSTIAPLASDVARRFESLHPGVRVDVQTGGSSRGVSDVRQGLADIGMVSRDLHDNERDLHAFRIARDGICLVVHSDNPVRELNVQQVAAIYTGRIENWKEVGGADAPIVVVHKAEGRSTLELFLGFFALKNSDVQADVVIGDNEQGIKTVQGNHHAIGYVSIGTAEYNATHGTPIRLLPMEGAAATVVNVTNGSYPLSRTLNLVTNEPPTGPAMEFIDFFRSEEVHDLIGEHYFVPAE